MTHPAKDLLIAIAEGKQMECEYYEGWSKCETWIALSRIADGHIDNVRIARPMVTRQVTYPEPLRVKPHVGMEYWTTSLSLDATKKQVWVGNAHDYRIFSAGMAFATEADAAEAHKALFGGGV